MLRRKQKRIDLTTLALFVAAKSVVLTAWFVARRRERRGIAGVMVPETEIRQSDVETLDAIEDIEPPRAETPNIRP